jgi:prophage regulatory protein
MSVVKSLAHTGGARRLPTRTARAAVSPTSDAAHSSSDAQASTAARHERLDGLPLRFIRFKAVRDRTGLSRSTIWRLERRGDFPSHRRLSANAVGWLEPEIDAWVRSRAGIQ